MSNDAPSAMPVTQAGERFDVVIPGDTPVSIIATHQDPDDESYRAFRFDWIAGDRVVQAGKREARQGPLSLPAVPTRSFLYMDNVHLPSDDAAASEQKSRLAWTRLGEGVWRLFFDDGDRDGTRDELVVTVRLLARQAPGVAATSTGDPDAPAAPATRPPPAVRAPLPSWGDQELGRPVHLNPCAACGGVDSLTRRVTDNKKWYWVRCDACGRSRYPEPTPSAAEESWNTDNPLPGQPVEVTSPPE